MKNRTLNIVKNKDQYLTYDVIYKNKYTLAKIERYQDGDTEKNKYGIFLVKETIGLDFELFDAEDKRYVAFDRSLKIVLTNIIDLMKEIKNIKRQSNREIKCNY